MNMQEAINKREELLAEERKINQAIKILNSDSIPKCAGITMAIGQYNRRLREITEEIRELARPFENNDRIDRITMYGEDKHEEKPKTEMPTWTGDSDLDFLVNLFHKAQLCTTRSQQTVIKNLFNMFIK